MFLKNKWFWMFALISFGFFILFYNPFSIRTVFKFGWDVMRNESIQIPNYPSKLSLFCDRLKLFVMKNKRTDVYNDTSLAGFKITFKNYSDLNQVFDEIFIEKCYFFKTQNPEPFIIDCGSNIGMSIIFFKMLYPRAKILGWEPVLENFDLINKNLKQNNLEGVTVIQKAVTDKKGKMALRNPGSIGGTLVYGNPSLKSEMVETTILSEYIDREVDCLKVDIEGGETAVIKELAESKKLGLVKEIILEFHNSPGEPSNKLGTILKIFDDFGFKYNINSSTVTRFSTRGFQALMIYAYK